MGTTAQEMMLLDLTAVHHRSGLQRVVVLVLLLPCTTPVTSIPTAHTPMHILMMMQMDFTPVLQQHITLGHCSVHLVLCHQALHPLLPGEGRHRHHQRHHNGNHVNLVVFAAILTARTQSNIVLMAKPVNSVVVVMLVSAQVNTTLQSSDVSALSTGLWG